MNSRIREITAIFILIMWTRESYGVEYNYDSASANLTTLSLINVKECDIPLQSVNSKVKLLQLNNIKSVRVIQCKVESDRLVRKCKMFSHTIDIYITANIHI